MPGHDTKGPKGRTNPAGAPLRRSHPLAGRLLPAKPSAPSSADEPDWEPVPAADAALPVPAPVKPAGPRLDGEGKPFVTLAQFLKLVQAAPTGGAAKGLARAGGILVNGKPEDRPGRKLHEGDQVKVEGRTHRVTVRS